MHLIKFGSACDIFNVSEDDVACQFFVLTLMGVLVNGSTPYFPEPLLIGRYHNLYLLRNISQGQTHMPFS